MSKAVSNGGGVPAFIAPMLAHALPDGATLAHYASGWVLEEKFDGQRLIACVGSGTHHRLVETWSRPRGSEAPLRKTVPAHVQAALASLPSGVYDGELIVPGGRSWDAARLDNRDRAQVKMFDVMELLGESVTSLSYLERRRLLTTAVAHVGPGPISLSPSWPVSEDRVKDIWASGGEGAILKRITSLYWPGRRVKDWLKVKQVQSACLRITHFLPGLTGAHARMQLVDDDGKTTSVKARNGAMLAAVERDPQAFIGRRVWIEFQSRTPTGAYRHPHLDRLEGFDG